MEPCDFGFLFGKLPVFSLYGSGYCQFFFGVGIAQRRRKPFDLSVFFSDFPVFLGEIIFMGAFLFHPGNTKLGEERGLRRVGAWEDLKMMALSRLILDNIDHIKAFWIMLTMPIAQLALGFGADDLDGTIGEEKIIHAAGAKTNTGITREMLEKMIRETGYEPVERDTFYHEVKA